MSVRRAAAAMLASAMVLGSISCGRSLFRQYEYEEEIYLKLDGSADVVVNASIPALVALRGASMSTDASTAVDREKVRALYESPDSEVTRISRPWRRAGRRFVQVRVRTRDIRSLARVSPFAWSAYRFDVRDGLYIYRQTMGGPVGPTPGGAIANGAGSHEAVSRQAGWDGSEVVVVRMHIPSKIRYHNAPSHEVERGNILAWEQSLRDRLAGKPLEIEVRMDTESILARTLLIFGISAAAALTLLAAIVVWIRRSGRPSA